MDQEQPQRPRSLRSVASNSTISSCASLSRRPRTRKRSKTVTGASSCPEEAPLHLLPVKSDLPYLSGSTAQESDEKTALGLSGICQRPPRPLKSPQRLQGAVELQTRSSDATSSQGGLATNVTVVSEPPPRAMTPSVKPAKPTKASSLPHLEVGYRPPPSAFSRDPALTPVNNVRDSVSTQQSGTSSSLYPPSTATASRVDSPATPASIVQDFESIHQSALMNPEVPEIREYDSDDVAYRLRLLVNNNYFLPPAHAKPSIAEFSPAPDTPKKAAKSPSPTFFDLFRKSKSKPTTPTTAVGHDHPAPMLRTTSDSIATSFNPRTQQSRPAGQIPHLSANIPGGPPRGRVVVVREKMEDIMVAAKQAEQDMKAKTAARMDQESQQSREAGDDAIDPTDAVDIPLPSPTYPFAVQASALHGLGVHDSVGADVLADRLPPNMSHSYDPVEDRWRKALLQEAVHHSLDNTADSSFSNVLGALTPKGSFRKLSVESFPPAVKVTAPQVLGQKIIDQPTIDMIESAPIKEKRPRSAASEAMNKTDTKSRLNVLTINNASQGSSRPGSFLPQRAETPQGPMTSLGPAPRRIYATLSQTDLTPANEQRPSHSLSDLDVRRGLRRIHSSPQLVEGCDSSAARLDTMPPEFRNSQATTTSTLRASYQTIIASPTEWGRQDSFLDMVQPRPSFATSRSEYSQASASLMDSVFQDSMNQPDQFGSESHQSHQPSRFSFEQQNALRASPSIRYSTMSPPPRISSSLAHIALPPPPRSSSLNVQTASRNQAPSSAPSDCSASSGKQPQSLEAATLQIVAPEPTTPPLPDQQRRREERPFRHQRSQSTRAVPSASTSAVLPVQSTPGPSSPTSFFDSIQSHPNAMDDLESSSDEEQGGPVIASPRRLVNDPRARAASTVALTSPRSPIMKHGNFSTPYLRPGASSSQHLLPASRSPSKMAIENVPLRSGKHEPPSSIDFFKYAQEHPPTTSLLSGGGGSRRPSSRPTTTEDSKSSPRPNPSAQESLKKLDGMLMRHMEDERDTIKRIALNMKQTAQS